MRLEVCPAQHSALPLAPAECGRVPPHTGVPVASSHFGVFAIVGLPFNWYWGWIPGMLLPLAWVHLPASFPRFRRSGPVQAGSRTPLVKTTVAAAVRTGG